MILTLPDELACLSESVNRLFHLAAHEGFDIPVSEIRTSEQPYISLSHGHEETAFLIDDMCNSDAVVTQNFDNAFYLHYQDCMGIADSLPGDLIGQYDDLRHVDSVPIHSRVYIEIFSRVHPGNISEHWQEQNSELNHQNQGCYFSRSEILSEDFDAFKRRHLSWFLLALMLDFPYSDALILARAASCVSRETWPKHLKLFPIPAPIIPDSNVGEINTFPAINHDDFTLYPVVDSAKWIEKLLLCGVKTIQLRIKDPEAIHLEQEIKRSVELGRQYQAQVFINDYWQLAIEYGAYGIHLGQEDLNDADLSAIKSAGLRIGISTHSYQEILQAESVGPSYIALGHIFPTTTKQMPSNPQGLVRLKLYQQLIYSMEEQEERRVPTVAIGGIDLSNAAQVLSLGVDSIAVVRAVTEAGDYTQAVGKLFELFHRRAPVAEVPDGNSM